MNDLCDSQAQCFEKFSDESISLAALEFYFELSEFILSRQYDWISEIMDASPECDYATQVLMRSEL